METEPVECTLLCLTTKSADVGLELAVDAWTAWYPPEPVLMPESRTDTEKPLELMTKVAVVVVPDETEATFHVPTNGVKAVVAPDPVALSHPDKTTKKTKAPNHEVSLGCIHLSA